MEAERFAKRKHHHLLRKDGKTPYWYHLRQVVHNLTAIGIDDDEVLCAGWLHDTIEDTDTDYDDLAEKFGTRVARIVVEVTKDKTLPERKKERAFCEKLSNSSWEAQVIKLCDLWANLADLESGYESGSKRIEQIKKKLKYYNAIKYGIAEHSARVPQIREGIEEISKILSANGFRPISLGS